MIVPIQVAFWYLGIGVVAMAVIFTWRKDMRSMVRNSLREMGMYGVYYVAATAVVTVVLLLMWIVVFALAVRRVMKGKPNVLEEE